MKAWEFNAVAFDGEIYCKDCLPEGAPQDLVTPVFSTEEVDEYPVCHECGEEHTYMGLTTDGRKRHTLSQTEIHTWFERDRSHVELRSKKTEETIVEFWDEGVQEEVESGYLNPKDWHTSCYELALERGMITR